MTKIETCPHCGNNYGVNLDRDRLKAEVAELSGFLKTAVDHLAGQFPQWEEQARAALARARGEPKEPQA